MAQPALSQNVGQIASGVAENGRVLATLDDWRAMGFLIAILFIVLVGIIFALLRLVRTDRAQIAKEREAMWTLSDKFGAAAEKLAVEAQVQSNLNARVETALKTCTDTLTQRERKR